MLRSGMLIEMILIIINVVRIQNTAKSIQFVRIILNQLNFGTFHLLIPIRVSDKIEYYARRVNWLWTDSLRYHKRYVGMTIKTTTDTYAHRTIIKCNIWIWFGCQMRLWNNKCDYVYFHNWYRMLWYRCFSHCPYFTGVRISGHIYCFRALAQSASNQFI